MSGRSCSPTYAVTRGTRRSVGTRRLRRLADVVREVAPQFEGELLELRGDEALCIFRSVRQALRASVELQRRFRTPTVEVPALPTGVGMGLDAGEAIPTNGGYRGSALNAAARLCSAARPGEILVTETVQRLAGRIEGVNYARHKPVTAKGFERPL